MTPDPTTSPFELAERAAAQLLERAGVEAVDRAVVLGSGWAEAADQIGRVVASVPLDELPGFPAPTVAGHANLARVVEVAGHRVLVIGGRAHGYEGHPPPTVVHGVRTAAAAGATVIVLTNAAGGLRPEWTPGSLVLISDQLNLTGVSPLAGPAPPDDLPGRFQDMSNAYSPRLRAIAHELDPDLPEGVYAGMPGGSYETPAEIRMLATLGADLVGMSTVLETIAARHLGMEVLGLSLVTNHAAGIGSGTLSHAEVLEAAASSRDAVVSLLGKILEAA